MNNNTKDQLTLGIISTDNSFGFACRKNKNNEFDNFFVKKFERDLCNNLIVDFANFFPKKNINQINKISVSIGPANFNASRLVVVLARTLSQQINCSLDSFSSFELMAKRIAIKNNIYVNKKTFWIFKKLKNRGYIAGKYEVRVSETLDKSLYIKELIIPRIYNSFREKSAYEAEYNDLEDLRELLTLSNKNFDNLKLDSWKNVIPLYTLSPIN